MANCSHGDSEHYVAYRGAKNLERNHFSFSSVCGDDSYHATATDTYAAVQRRGSLATLGAYRPFLLFFPCAWGRPGPVRTNTLVGQTAARRIGCLTFNDSLVAYPCHHGGERQVYLFQQVFPLSLLGAFLARPRRMLGDYRIYL